MTDSDKINVQVWLDVRWFVDAVAEASGAQAAGLDVCVQIPVLASLRDRVQFAAKLVDGSATADTHK